jgi:hypothetical protein
LLLITYLLFYLLPSLGGAGEGEEFRSSGVAGVQTIALVVGKDICLYFCTPELQ